MNWEGAGKESRRKPKPLTQKALKQQYQKQII